MGDLAVGADVWALMSNYFLFFIQNVQEIAIPSNLCDPISLDPTVVTSYYWGMIMVMCRMYVSLVANSGFPIYLYIYLGTRFAYLSHHHMNEWWKVLGWDGWLYLH